MAIAKRGTRPLVVGGSRFRWRCEFNYPLEKSSVAWFEGRITTPDRLLIRPEDGPHRLLTVSWPACEGPIVKPGLVRACIEEAVRRGWLTEAPTIELLGEQVPVPTG